MSFLKSILNGNIGGFKSVSGTVIPKYSVGNFVVNKNTLDIYEIVKITLSDGKASYKCVGPAGSCVLTEANLYFVMTIHATREEAEEVVRTKRESLSVITIEPRVEITTDIEDIEYYLVKKVNIVRKVTTIYGESTYSTLGDRTIQVDEIDLAHATKISTSSFLPLLGHPLELGLLNFSTGELVYTVYDTNGVLPVPTGYLLTMLVETLSCIDPVCFITYGIGTPPLLCDVYLMNKGRIIMSTSKDKVLIVERYAMRVELDKVPESVSESGYWIGISGEYTGIVVLKEPHEVTKEYWLNIPKQIHTLLLDMKERATPAYKTDRGFTCADYVVIQVPDKTVSNIYRAEDYQGPLVHLTNAYNSKDETYIPYNNVAVLSRTPKYSVGDKSSSGSVVSAVKWDLVNFCFIYEYKDVVTTPAESLTAEKSNSGLQEGDFFILPRESCVCKAVRVESDGSIQYDGLRINTARQKLDNAEFFQKLHTAPKYTIDSVLPDGSVVIEVLWSFYLNEYKYLYQNGVNIGNVLESELPDYLAMNKKEQHVVNTERQELEDVNLQEGDYFTLGDKRLVYQVVVTSSKEIKYVALDDVTRDLMSLPEGLLITKLPKKPIYTVGDCIPKIGVVDGVHWNQEKHTFRYMYFQDGGYHNIDESYILSQSLSVGDFFRINRSMQVNEVVDIDSNGDVKFKALDSTESPVRILQESFIVHKLQGKPKFLPGDLVERIRVAYVVWDDDNDCYAYQSVSFCQIPVEGD